MPCGSKRLKSTGVIFQLHLPPIHAQSPERKFITNWRFFGKFLKGLEAFQYKKAEKLENVDLASLILKFLGNFFENLNFLWII